MTGRGREERFNEEIKVTWKERRKEKNTGGARGREEGR